MAETWRPLPDGDYKLQSAQLRVDDNGNHLAQWIRNSEPSQITLITTGYRLCELVEVDTPPAPLDMPDEVRDVIKSALLRYEYMHDKFLEPKQTAKAKAALAWLDAQRKEDGRERT
jgi:hypothetical protein